MLVPVRVAMFAMEGARQSKMTCPVLDYSLSFMASEAKTAILIWAYSLP